MESFKVWLESNSGGVPKEFWSYKVNWYFLNDKGSVHKDVYDPENIDSVKRYGPLYQGSYKIHDLKSIKIPYVPCKHGSWCRINAILWDEKHEGILAHEYGHWHIGPSEPASWKFAVKTFGKELFLKDWDLLVRDGLSSYGYKPETIELLKRLFQERY